MRLDYVPDPPPVSSAEDSSIVESIRQRRGARGLTSLDRTLLHSAPIASGWNSFMGAIRTKTTLSESIRETAICRVAVLNRAWYELEHHAPLLLNASVSDEKVAESTPVSGLFVRAVLEQQPGTWFASGDDSKAAAPVPDVKHALILAVTDALTLLAPVSLAANIPADAPTYGVSRDLFFALKGHFNDTEIVELVATISSYNSVSRFLLALDVGEREGPNGLVVALTNVINGKGGEILGKVLDVSRLIELVPAPRVYVEK